MTLMIGEACGCGGEDSGMAYVDAAPIKPTPAMMAVAMSVFIESLPYN
jgi:hypothetical protein